MDEIKNLNDLSKIIDLCRKKGIASIEIQGIKLELRSDIPPSHYKRKKAEESPEITEDLLSEEKALFWSSTPVEGIQ